MLLKDPRDRKPFPITLDTVYIDSCGISIYIMFIAHLTAYRRQIEMTLLCKIEMTPSAAVSGCDPRADAPQDGR
jgi:hypothetical protein